MLLLNCPPGESGVAMQSEETYASSTLAPGQVESRVFSVCDGMSCLITM